MNDYTRLVFDALNAAGSPDADQRAHIYEACRAEVAGSIPDETIRIKALEALEKVIRRQEMQAIYEETHTGMKPGRKRGWIILGLFLILLILSTFSFEQRFDLPITGYDKAEEAVVTPATPAVPVEHE